MSAMFHDVALRAATYNGHHFGIPARKSMCRTMMRCCLGYKGESGTLAFGLRYQRIAQQLPHDCSLTDAIGIIEHEIRLRRTLNRTGWIDTRAGDIRLERLREAALMLRWARRKKLLA